MENSAYLNLKNINKYMDCISLDNINPYHINLQAVLLLDYLFDVAKTMRLLPVSTQI